MIQVGDAIPALKLTVVTPDGPKETAAEDLFAGKTVVLFAVPGAFTPTCSARHLPGYLQNMDALAEKGVDTVACTSVNDAFVLAAWGRDQGVDGRITLLADGNAALAKALGLDQDMTARGFGIRSKRYAMVVKDGKVASLSIEEPGEFEVSKAESVLAGL